MVISYHEIISGKGLIDYQKHDQNLRLIFNRDWTKGLMFKEENAMFTNIDQQNHIGVFMGKVLSTYKDKVNIKLSGDLSFGDSIRLVGKVTDAVTVNQMYVDNKLVKKASTGDIVTIKTHISGLEDANVFITTSKEQIDFLESTYKTDNFNIQIDGKCYLENDHLVLEVSDGRNSVKRIMESLPEVARSDQKEKIKEQLLKTASTIFSFRSLEIKDNVFVPLKELNQLRRDTLDDLIKLREVKHQNRRIEEITKENISSKEEKVKVKAKVIDEKQLLIALEYPFDEIYIADYAVYQKYSNRENIYYYVPRNNQQSYCEKLVTSDISLVRYGHSAIYSNVTNSFTVRQLEKLGADTIGLSLELSFTKMKALLAGYQRRYGSLPSLEIMVYGYYELMIMAYCPLNKALGFNKKGCKECLKNQYYLNDRLGYDFPLMRDEECNMKILNSKKLHLIEHLDDIINIGIKNLLLDFSLETEEEMRKVIGMYFDRLNGKVINEEIEKVTYGHFLEGVI